MKKDLRNACGVIGVVAIVVIGARVMWVAQDKSSPDRHLSASPYISADDRENLSLKSRRSHAS